MKSITRGGVCIRLNISIFLTLTRTERELSIEKVGAAELNCGITTERWVMRSYVAICQGMYWWNDCAWNQTLGDKAGKGIKVLRQEMGDRDSFTFSNCFIDVMICCACEVSWGKPQSFHSIPLTPDILAGTSIVSSILPI